MVRAILTYSTAPEGEIVVGMWRLLVAEGIA